MLWPVTARNRSVWREVRSLGAGHVPLDPGRIEGPVREQRRQGRRCGCEPFPHEGPPRRNPGAKPLRERIADNVVPTGVRTDEFGFGDDIAVEKHENVVGGHPRAGVAGAREAEPAPRLTHHAQVQQRIGGRFSRAGSSHRRRSPPRSRPAGPVLTFEPGERKRKRFGRLVGGHDDADGAGSGTNAPESGQRQRKANRCSVRWPEAAAGALPAQRRAGGGAGLPGMRRCRTLKRARVPSARRGAGQAPEETRSPGEVDGRRYPRNEKRGAASGLRSPMAVDAPSHQHRVGQRPWRCRRPRVPMVRTSRAGGSEVPSSSSERARDCDQQGRGELTRPPRPRMAPQHDRLEAPVVEILARQTPGRSRAGGKRPPVGDRTTRPRHARAAAS